MNQTSLSEDGSPLSGIQIKVFTHQSVIAPIMAATGAATLVAPMVITK